jgi:glycosyltransferase involved in cell wall biosynthesis
MESLVKDIPDVHGLFVGGCKTGSRYQAELETLAGKMGIRGNMTFTGDRLDIRDWMSESALVFNLSNDPPEAFGRTVLETLCLGRPMIAWSHGGAAEIMAAMFPAGAVAPLDFAVLENRTREFLESQPAVEESGAFTLEDSMNKHLDVYLDLVEGRKP